MKGVKHYPCQYKAMKNVWVTAKVFRGWLLCLERKMACKKQTFFCFWIVFWTQPQGSCT